MPITARTTVQHKRDALAADVGGEFVLMSVEQGKYFGLDEIGSEVWRRIEQPVGVAQLCAALASEYDGEAAVIERDVIALLQQLGEHDFLEDLGETSAA